VNVDFQCVTKFAFSNSLIAVQFFGLFVFMYLLCSRALIIEQLLFTAKRLKYIYKYKKNNIMAIREAKKKQLHDIYIT